MQRWLTVLVAMLAAPAYPSESSESVTLERVVGHSDVVILAERADPATRTVDVPIGPKAPPYRRVLQRWVIREVLKGGDRKVSVGAVLDVDTAQLETRLTVHRRYHLEGVRKIPIYEVYSRQEPDGEGPQLVFLRRIEKGFELTAQGAVEGRTKRAQVDALLAKE